MVDADVEALVFEDFFRDEYPRLVPMLHVLTGDRHRAEDLAQEALLRAQRDWRRISAYDRPGAWVRRVALHAASNVSRRRGGRSGRSAASVWRETTTELPAADEGLWRAVRELPDQQRWAVVLHYVEDRAGRRGGGGAGVLGGNGQDPPVPGAGDARPPARGGEEPLMDTRTPDDVVDEQLRAAGARMRATAPPPEATEAALAELQGHPGALRRIWWVLPGGRRRGRRGDDRRARPRRQQRRGGPAGAGRDTPRHGRADDPGDVSAGLRGEPAVVGLRRSARVPRHARRDRRTQSNPSPRRSPGWPARATTPRR